MTIFHYLNHRKYVEWEYGIIQLFSYLGHDHLADTSVHVSQPLFWPTLHQFHFTSSYIFTDVSSFSSLTCYPAVRTPIRYRVSAISSTDRTDRQSSRVCNESDSSRRPLRLVNYVKSAYCFHVNPLSTSRMRADGQFD